MNHFPPIKETPPTLDIPEGVQGFLDPAIRNDSVGCLTALCSGPAKTFMWCCEEEEDPGVSDQRFSQLVMSGLLQACMDTIETGEQCENKPVQFSSTLFTISCEKDIVWLYPTLFNERKGCSSSLVPLTNLKIALHAIRFLGRSERTLPEDITVSTLRLIYRTLSKYPLFDSLDAELLWTGAVEARWERAAEAARSECDASRPMSHFVHPTALENILQPPSAQDRALIRWILRTDVFAAIGGWYNSSACRRSPEVAAKAKSWRLFHELLLVGHKSTLDIETTMSFNDEINIAAKNLMAAPMEQRDGSKRPMPRVYLVCAAEGCTKPSLQVCTRCKTLSYCSKGCQRKHWKSTHKHECVAP